MNDRIPINSIKEVQQDDDPLIPYDLFMGTQSILKIK